MDTRTPQQSPLPRRLGAAVLLACLPLAALAMPGGAGCGPEAGRQAMHGQGSQHGHGAMSGPGQAGPMGAGMHGGGPLGHLLRGLELDEAQQDKVFALMHARAPVEREQRKAAAKAMADLQQLAAADSFDAARARTLADAHGKAVAAMTLAQAELEAGVRALLTPEQRRERDQKRDRMHESMHNRMHDGAGGPGRPPRGR